MADRKAELERKKAKLQAIREEKERRRREKEQKDVSCILFKRKLFALVIRQRNELGSPRVIHMDYQKLFYVVFFADMQFH